MEISKLPLPKITLLVTDFEIRITKIYYKSFKTNNCGRLNANISLCVHQEGLNAES